MQPTAARRRVGAYEIIGEIARGGMAIVHLAHQPALARDVALKELAPFPFDDGALAERFLREARVAGSLKSEHIVQVYDYIEADGVPFIAMEYLERGSLRPHIGRLTLPQVAGVLEGILAGLAHAHAQGIVHRDLKPENVLVTSDGAVKIADFGIAKAISSVKTALTATGTAVGTPRYMAPEQAQARGIGPWTDLYAVGVMAYEMLLGRVPFDDPDQWALLMAHITEPLPPPLEIDPTLHAGIAAWLERMLAKEPADRPRSAREAWDRLDDCIVAAEGSFWRRAARLDEWRDREATGALSRPLSEAEFPSAADAASVVEPGYVTFEPAPDPVPPIEPEPLRPATVQAPQAQTATPLSAPVPQPQATVQAPVPTAAPQLPAPFTRPAPEPIAQGWQSSPELVVTVAPHVQDEPAAVGADDLARPEPAGAAKPRRPRRIARAASAVAVAAAAAAAALAMLGSPEPEPVPALSMKAVEAAVRERMPANDVRAVRCPSGTPRQVGVTVECEAFLAGGGEMPVTIRQTASGVTAEPHL